MIVSQIISSCVKLLESRRVVGGAVNKIILGCQAFGLLSEQGVAKNSSEGRGEHSGTQRGTEGVRGNTGAATKMASKGETLGLKRKEENLR